MKAKAHERSRRRKWRTDLDCKSRRRKWRTDLDCKMVNVTRNQVALYPGCSKNYFEQPGYKARNQVRLATLEGFNVSQKSCCYAWCGL